MRWSLDSDTRYRGKRGGKGYDESQMSSPFVEGAKPSRVIKCLYSYSDMYIAINNQ